MWSTSSCPASHLISLKPVTPILPPLPDHLTGLQVHITGVHRGARDQREAGGQCFPRIAKELWGALRHTHWGPAATAEPHSHTGPRAPKRTYSIHPGKHPPAHVHTRTHTHRTQIHASHANSQGDLHTFTHIQLQMCVHTHTHHVQQAPNGLEAIHCSTLTTHPSSSRQKEINGDTINQTSPH